jgi:hypothetical protein
MAQHRSERNPETGDSGGEWAVAANAHRHPRPFWRDYSHGPNIDRHSHPLDLFVCNPARRWNPDTEPATTHDDNPGRAAARRRRRLTIPDSRRAGAAGPAPALASRQPTTGLVARFPPIA